MTRGRASLFKKRRDSSCKPEVGRIRSWKAAGAAGILLLVFLGAVVITQRWHTREEPFECDIASHAVIAHEMLSGRDLYSDLWDLKPPAIWVTYAAAELLVGYGPNQVLALGILAALVTLGAVFAAGMTQGGRTAAIAGAVAWTVICSDLWLQANQPNIEVFINAFMAWALTLTLGFRGHSFEWKRSVIIGLLFAIASLYKQVTVVMVLALAIAHVMAPPGGKDYRRRAFGQVGLWLGIGVGTWALVDLYFVATGRGSIFWATMLEYPRYYSTSLGGSMVANLLAGLRFSSIPTLWYTSVWPIVIVAALGTMFGLVSGPRRSWLLVFACLLGAQIAISLPGRFYAHYYQLLLPGLAIAAGLVAGTVFDRLRPGLRWLPQLGAGIALTATLIFTSSAYGLSAEEWSITKYNGAQFVISKKLAIELQGKLEEEDGLYVWGANPELYFWTQCRPPTGVIWSSNALDGPLAQKFSRRIAADLERTPPSAVVINMLHIARPAGNPVIDWIIPRYEVVSSDTEWNGLFAVAIHRDSDLLRSWNDQADTER